MPWAVSAEVIKVEIPKKGDDTRHWGPPFKEHKDPDAPKWTKDLKREAAYFLAVNRNKKSVTLNLKSPKGLKIAKELAKKVDVVVENVSRSYITYKAV
jgi:succinate--hydroxymethylglutarate CoA-transferase